MNKLAVVLGVVAIATLSGCKDPDYVGKRRPAEPPATPIDTTPAPVTPEPEKVAPAPEAPAKPVATTPAPAPVAQPKADEGEYTIYVVQSGDYLSKISAKYNVSMNAIRRLNPSMKKDIVRVGMKLKLPGKIDVGVQNPAPAAAPAKPAKGFKAYEGATKEYVVKSGDTLGGIAYSNGMNIRQLKQLNGLTKDSLVIGQKLKVAADGKAAAKPAKPAAADKDAKPSKTDRNPAGDAVKPADNTPTTPATEPAANVSTPPPAADPAPAAIATVDYVVQEGEDILGIAVSYNTSASVIRELNGFSQSDTVKAGQTIKIPAEGQQ